MGGLAGRLASDMGTTLFLGSGFSRAAGLPTMAQFARAFRTIYTQKRVPLDRVPWLSRLGEQEIEAVCAAVYCAEYTANAPEHLALNIEWTLAQLDMLLTLRGREWGIASFDPASRFEFVPADRPNLYLRDCYDRVKAALVKVYRDPAVDLADASPLIRLMSALRPSRIITTNYDRVAETVLDKTGLPWSHYGTQMPPPTDVIQIMKLHGDTLWEEQGTQVWGLRPHEEGKPNEAPVQWAVLSIVLPTWIRMPPSPGLQNIWRYALLAITECEHFVIVGFGLPATDQHVAHLLTSALSGLRGDELVPKKITIVDPDAGAVSRLLAVVPGRLRHRVTVFPMTVEEFAG